MQPKLIFEFGIVVVVVIILFPTERQQYKDKNT